MPPSAANTEMQHAPVVRVEGVRVERRAGVAISSILEIDRLELARGESLSIAGASGAGKSTLLNLVAGLLHPQAGTVSWHGERIDLMNNRARDEWRRNTIGFVFQDFHLIEELSALQNVLLPTRFDAFRLPQDARGRAQVLLDRVGISETRKPASQMSRGERQRVAVARALAAGPKLLLADEPTASLDSDSAIRIVELIFQLTQETGASLIVASHDAQVLARADRRVTLMGGRIMGAVA